MKDRGRDPTVAVVIPTYNRAALLCQALESVLAQTHKPDIVVVVDDGSTDTTADAISHYGQRVTCLHQHNAGKSVALNNALSILDVGYVWVLDDDDVAVPDGLERHLQTLSENPEADFTYSGHYEFAGDLAPPPPDRCGWYEKPDLNPNGLFFKALEDYPFRHESMLVPLACYRAVGPFDESLARSQDYEMILRIARRFRGARVEIPTFFSRRHDGLRGPAAGRHRADERELVWVECEADIFRKLYSTLPLSDYVPIGVQRQNALLRRACIMSRHGLFSLALKDFRSALPGESVTPSLTGQDAKAFSGIVNVRVLLAMKSIEPFRAMLAFLHQRSPSLLEYVFDGFRWNTREQLRRRRYVNAIRLLILGIRTIRFGSALAIYGRKTLRRFRGAPAAVRVSGAK